MKIVVKLYCNADFSSVTVSGDLVWHSDLDEGECLPLKLYSWFESLSEEYPSTFKSELEELRQLDYKVLEGRILTDVFMLCVERVRFLCYNHSINYTIEDEYEA